MSTPSIAADRLDIAAVLALHAYAADHGDAELVRQTLTIDARVASPLDPLNEAFEVEQLVALVSTLTSDRTRETVLRNTLIDVQGDAARVTAELDFVELELLADGASRRRQLAAPAVGAGGRTPG